MKKIICAVLFVSIICSCFASCKGGKITTVSKLKENDFITEKRIRKIADLTPNYSDADALKLYCDLGFDTFILTEDDVSMVKDGKLSDSYKNAIKILSEAGLQVWIRNMYNDPDCFENDVTKDGSNYGALYTLEPRKITNEFSEFPSVTGFYMADEAYMTTLEDDPATEMEEKKFSAFDQFSKMINWKNTYYPDLYTHFNHVPSSSVDHFRGYTYKEFLQSFVNQITKKLNKGGRSICLDNYPWKNDSEIVKDSYLFDLLTAALVCKNYNDNASKENQADFGLCLQTFQDTNLSLRDITSTEDITMQMYTGMCLGAKLYEYFCYRSFEAAGLNGIVDSMGNKRIYDFVKEATERQKALERVALSFDWYGLKAYEGEDDKNKNTFEDVQNMLAENVGVLDDVECRYDTIVGCFKKGNQDGYMAVNYTNPCVKQTDIVTLKFKDCSSVLVFTEDGCKSQNLVGGNEIRLILPAGSAAFVIPE